jgi:S1-C subfamily serine protease
MEFSRVRENVPAPPVGLYAQSSEYPLPALQTAPPLVTAAPPAPPSSPAPAEQIIAHVRGSLLRIEAEAPTANRRGTGFVVGPRLIATCAHLVQDTSGITVTQVNGEVLRARVERLDLLNDLALLSTQGDLPAALHLDLSGRVEPGEPIAVTGFPSGPENPDGKQDLTMVGTMLGWVTRNSPSGERVQLLQITADVRHGHSGGPVYSLRDGRVLGLISFRVAGENVSGFAAGMPMLYELWSTPPAADTSSTF